MKRREFITLLGGAAAAWPVAARAKQATMPVVGHLTVGPPAEHLTSTFREGLAEAGYVEGRKEIVAEITRDRHERLFVMDAAQRRARALVTRFAAPIRCLAQLLNEQ
jgi:putative ABC transport system substrate-binding protein